MDILELADKATNYDVTMEIEYIGEGMRLIYTTRDGAVVTYEVITHEERNLLGLRRVNLRCKDDDDGTLFCVGMDLDIVETVTYKGRAWQYIGVLDSLPDYREEDPFDIAWLDTVERVQQHADQWGHPWEIGRYNIMSILIPGGSIRLNVWRRTGVFYEADEKCSFREVEEIEAHITALRKGKAAYELYKRTCF